MGGCVEKQAGLLLRELEQDTPPLWVSPAMVMILPQWGWSLHNAKRTVLRTE